MIEEIGTVTRVSDEHIWVETQIKTTCGSCEQKSDCSTGVIAKTVASKTQTFKLSYQKDAIVGQQVKLGLPEQTLLGVSALFYMLPLVMMLLVGGLADLTTQWLALSGEWLVVVASLSSLVGSFYMISQWLKTKNSESYQPQLLALLTPEEQKIPVKIVP